MCNDFFQSVYCEIYIFHGCLFAESHTQGTMCDLVWQSDCQKYMGRI